MRFCVNVHFSGFRYRSCFSSLSKTWWTHSRWSIGSSGVAISMSSIYTVSQPSQISSLNMVFIMDWKVAGELVMPKNMTVGLYNPLGVWKAALHSSPPWILMLLYPIHTSNLVNQLDPLSLSMMRAMLGIGWAFLTVFSLR